MRPLNVFVAPTGNAFMTDIAGWLVEAGALLGRTATLIDDGTPPHDPGAVNLVVAPHEFYLLSEFDDRTIHRAAEVSVPVCTEQPNTPWFQVGLVTAAAGPFALDINPRGVDALEQAGVNAGHLRLGGVPSMRAPAHDRDVDVLFLGGKTDRRARVLAGLAQRLWPYDVDLRLFSFTKPVRPGTPGLVFGADKYTLLAQSRILLNIHRDDGLPGYFEWARMVEAMANGCCIVTEPVADHAPFVEGEHFVATDDLDGALAELLDDPEQVAAIGEAAQRAVLEDFGLARSMAPLLDDLDRLVLGASAPRRVPKYRRRLIQAQQQPLLPAFKPNTAIRARLYRALVAETNLQRRIERARSLHRHGVDDHVERVTSAAYDAATPQVSVVVTLYDYADVVTETFESVIGSEDVDIELVVVDDHSTDAGRAVVTEFIADHPDVPILLLGSDINRGLPAARNLAFESARAEHVMVMDADNLIYPNALARLSAALDADTEAAFAYSSLEEFGVSTGVRSAMAWNPQRLCESNYIDAQAMVRRSAWQRHGGYRTGDELVFGWEDWELWLRIAAAGERGVHVAQLLGRYRTQAESMIATSNLVADQMMAHLRELHPGLPWPTD